MNTEGHSISSSDLIAYLTNINKLITSINQTLNAKYTIGFDLVEVDVIALEAGSFKIPLSIKKITNNPTVATIAGGVISGLILNLFVNNNEPQIIQYGEDRVVVTAEELLRNKETANAVGGIARMAVESEKINGITITYEKADGEPEEVSISKRSLSQVMYNEPEDESLSNTISNVSLRIISSVYVGNSTLWKATYDNRIITVKITDKSFLNKKNISMLVKGCEIIADLEVIAKTTEKGINVTYYIRKVHECRKLRIMQVVDIKNIRTAHSPHIALKYGSRKKITRNTSDKKQIAFGEVEK